MKPIYFPYTTISEPLLGAILTCFKQVVVYQPSRNHVPESLRNREAGGSLQIRLPDEDENDPLPHLLKAYHEWAELHKGERPDFEKFRPPLTPYTDTSATSRIRSDIRKAAKGSETAPSREDRERSMLLRARLFLTVAQEHDQLRQALREDLDRIGEMEKVLFRNLLSDRDEPSPVKSLNRSAEVSETDCYMPGARMTAWARLHLHHRKPMDSETGSMPEPPDLLITSDPAVLELLLAQAAESDMIWTVSGIPFGSVADVSGNVLFDGRLSEKLRQLAAGSVPSTGLDTLYPDTENRSGDTGRLTLYRVRGDAVAGFLSGSESHPEASGKLRVEDEKRFTLVGSIVRMDP